MKILFLTPAFFPEIGGVEKHVLKISEELIKKRHQIYIVTELRTDYQHNNKIHYQSRGKSDIGSHKSNQPVKSIQSVSEDLDGIKIYRLNFGKNNWFKKFRIWATLSKNWQLIRDADVVHAHDVYFWYLPFRFLFPFKKNFVTFHGYETKFPPTYRAKFIRKISELTARGNICVGRFIEKWYGTKANFITYGGVDTKIKDYRLKIIDKKNRKLRILFIGRLTEDNGVATFLKGLDILKKQSIKFEINFCGDGPLRKSAEKYGRAIGFVPSLTEYINRADIIFSSSYLSILEALSLGKPVFSVAQNELKRDYLEMSSFARFVNIVSSPRELADALPKRSKNSLKEGQDWAQKQSWGDVANLYIRLWRI